ncbi:hypothetical protein AIOL_002028 [Candidatus Rhodobacter oscarellae]|uniref:Uncharacterized protein n=1 Tax=Candidatus Rhodobacter oscarellae TaxID=1675527 RepID=A0A0J9E2W2_9RHOB|nr:hypothetical protein AIOL_002028 [Candidatus Rhodobacter lobularis]
MVFRVYVNVFHITEDGDFGWWIKRKCEGFLHLFGLLFEINALRR